MLRVRFHDGLDWPRRETKVEPRAVTLLAREKKKRNAVDDGLLASVLWACCYKQ